MARQTDAEELSAAWRALIGDDQGASGWRTIPVAANLPARVRAGRHFPGNDEALLVGFSSAQLPSATRLPEGRGFRVSLVKLTEAGDDVSWVALSRLGIGTLEMFAAMSADILNAIAGLRDAREDRIIQSFLARITAWQYFMERGGDSLLGIEAQVGLHGELLLLRDLLDSGVEPALVIEAWRGPLGAARDFEIDNAAIEVKSTLSTTSFPAVISSFEQLDDSTGRELYVAAVRLAPGATGTTLPELVQRISAALSGHAPALERFEALIIRAGFLLAHADRYDRRLLCVERRLLPVTEPFPRLIRSKLSPVFLRGHYEIDLDRVGVQATDLNAVLARLGVI